MNIFGVPSLEGIIAKFATEVKEIRHKQAQDRERLRNEWEKTKSMPRKLKKRRRKEILTDWAIADYDILGGITDKELDDCLNTFCKTIGLTDTSSYDMRPSS